MSAWKDAAWLLSGTLHDHPKRQSENHDMHVLPIEAE